MNPSVAVPRSATTRRRLAFIDRRFYRRKYAAEQVLAVFGESVRDEVDPDRLAAAALSVVEETMQPAHSSLWLAKQRSPGRVV